MPRKPPPPRKKEKGNVTHKFDLKQVEALRGIMASHKEMAAILGCSEKTIERRKVDDAEFLEAYEMGEAKAHLSIRRSLFKACDAGNVNAAVYLSKNYLGMRDVQAMQHSGPNDGPIEHKDAGMDLAKLSVEELRQLRALREKASAE